MRRPLLMLLASVLGTMAFATQAQAAAPAARHVTVVGLSGPAADALAARISAAGARRAFGAGPAATNPCLGAHVLCLFQDSDGGGDVIAFTDAALRQPGVINLNDSVLFPCCVHNDGIHGNDGTWSDDMSSWGNDTGQTYCWWEDLNGGIQPDGASVEGHVMRSQGGTIQNVVPTEDDTASSVDVTASTCH